MYCIDCYGLLSLKGDWKEQKLVLPHEETLLMILLNWMIELWNCFSIYWEVVSGCDWNNKWFWTFQVIISPQLNLTHQSPLMGITTIVPQTPDIIPVYCNWCWLSPVYTNEHLCAFHAAIVHVYVHTVHAYVHTYVCILYICTYITCVCIHCTVHVYIQYMCVSAYIVHAHVYGVYIVHRYEPTKLKFNCK